MSGPGAAADEANAAAKAQNAADAANLAANQAVETAQELAAKNADAAAAEVARIRDETNANIAKQEERLGAWRTELESLQTASASSLAERISGLETGLGTLKQETATALEAILARLTPQSPENNPPVDPNTQAEQTKTGLPPKSGDAKPEPRQTRDRTIHRL